MASRRRIHGREDWALLHEDMDLTKEIVLPSSSNNPQRPETRPLPLRSLGSHESSSLRPDNVNKGYGRGMPNHLGTILLSRSHPPLSSTLTVALR